MTDRVLVAGIGNIFLGDDGFGSEVVRRLRYDGEPRVRYDGEPRVRYDGEPRVRVVDYGIRGMHLAYDLLDGWDALVLVDAVPDRGAPGRIEVLRAEPGTDGVAELDAHAMNPAAVFAGVRALGGAVPPTVVVGCQVESVDERLGLSGPVENAVDAAVLAVREVLAELLRSRQEV